MILKICLVLVVLLRLPGRLIIGSCSEHRPVYIRMDHHRNNFFGRAGNAAEADICGKSYSQRLVMWNLDVSEIPLNTTRASYDSYSIK